MLLVVVTMKCVTFFIAVVMEIFIASNSQLLFLAALSGDQCTMHPSNIRTTVDVSYHTEQNDKTKTKAT